MQCAVPYRHLWAVTLYNSPPPKLALNGAIFENKLLNIKCVFWFSLQILSETFLIVRRNERAVIKNICWSSYKVSFILVRFYWPLNFLDRFSKNPSNIKFHENMSSGSRVICGRTDRHDEANSRFSHFCEGAQKSTLKIACLKNAGLL
jgi:hypothetical protein